MMAYERSKSTQDNFGKFIWNQDTYQEARKELE